MIWFVYSVNLLFCFIIVILYLQFGFAEWSVFGLMNFPCEFCFPSTQIVLFDAQISDFFIEIILSLEYLPFSLVVGLFELLDIFS
jgi:hypothetical protein